MTQRLRPGIAEPVFLMFSRQQIETGDIGEPLAFLRGLTATPRAALDYCGRISLMVDGYNDDPREIFEISEVRAFIKGLDAQWPYNRRLKMLRSPVGQHYGLTQFTTQL
ncbi:MAG: hypothetical protein KDA88_19045 [Planctomycetaceae bacterium]|nr:hypothetical protein [Planctomycetaceae bacterium]